jgi:hypothetical protein
MTEGDQATPVAVFAVSDDANEDKWAQATWHAELAAREAAINAEAAEGDLTRSFEGYGVVVITTADGRRFEAWVVADPAVSRYSYGERVDPSRYGRPARQRSS